MSLHSSIKETFLTSYRDDPATEGYVEDKISTYNSHDMTLAGGTMTGPLILFRDPESNYEAATRQYVDTFLPRIDGTPPDELDYALYIPANNVALGACKFSVGGTTFTADQSTGFVGIGTSYPIAPLNVNATTSSTIGFMNNCSLNSSVNEALIGFANDNTFNPTYNGNVPSATNAYFYPVFNPSVSTSIGIATNLLLETGYQGAGGSIGTGYNLYVKNPSFGTNKIALYSDNLAIGYTNTPPPSNGAIISGSVGIGTSSPGAIFTVSKASFSAAPGSGQGRLSHVSGTWTDNSTAASGTAATSIFNYYAANSLAATNTSVTTTNAYNIYIAGAPTASTNQTITNSYALFIASGKVGLGTSDFSINTNKFTVTASSGNTTISGSLTVSTLTSTGIVFAGSSGLLTTNQANLSWDNTNTRLGIGTSSPNAILSVIKSSFSAAPGSGQGRLSHFGGNWTDNSTAASGTAATAIFNYYSANTLFATNTSVTTTNAYNIYIAGAPSAQTNQTITNSYALYVADGKVAFGTSDFSINTNKFTVSASSGYVGLGLASPSYQLDLSTDNARKLTSTTWLTGSDQRIKTNIEDADIDICYSNIKNIKLHRFEWDSTLLPDVDDRHVIGFIAQEVQTILPKAVKESNDYGFSDFKSLDTDQLNKCLFGCVQKLIVKVEALEAQVLALQE
jgi:hypothetical protein